MSAASRVVLRADAGLEVGNGHVMRCLTLADVLAAGGARCSFVSRATAGHLLELIRGRGHAVVELPADPDEATDARLTAAELAQTRADWLVVDHYGLDARWESRLQRDGLRVLVIDDLANRAHQARLLLDQNLGRHTGDYAAHLPPDCGRLIGPAYALVRPEFAAVRPASLARRADATLRQVLVGLGGVDAHNATAVVLRALAACPLPVGLHVSVVLGPRAPWADAVRAQAALMPWPCDVQIGVADMARPLAWADLAIGATGISAWERCTLGLPSLLVLLADNQAAGAAALNAAGAALLLGAPAALPQSLPAALQALVLPGALQAMSAAAAAVTDGLGAARVVQAMAVAGV